METVYVETTIPSFYFEARKEPEMVARRNWTRQWWDQRAKKDFDLVTPNLVTPLELLQGE